MRLCMGCIAYINESEDVCPHCGYMRGTPPHEAYFLRPETVLNGRYVIGRSLGHGGFGVAYIGWDTQLERKVAVKEYLPGDFSTRMPGETSVTVYKNEASQQFHAGLKSFLEEARRLAKFNSKPGIVDIYDTFSQNGTAYIIMQLLDGGTLEEIMRKNGAFKWEDARDIILKALETLAEVHKECIIHRDISPDNIFLTNSGEVKLLDFGTARHATTFHSKSLSVILKLGYAPEEQYRSHGKQGPYTDVYAAAATFYKMITDITPQEAMERIKKDDVLPPSKLIKTKIPKSVETAVMNAMNVKVNERTQSAEDFISELTMDGVKRKKSTVRRSDTGSFPLWMKIAVSVSGAALIAAAVLIVVGLNAEVLPEVIPVSLEASGTDVTVPSVLNQNEEAAQARIEASSLAFKITGKDNNDRVAAGTIFSQNPQGGLRAAPGTDVEVQISAGPVSEYMPGVLDKYEDTAVKELTALGFRVRTSRAAGKAAPDAILSQDIAEGVSVPRNSVINLVVSDGYASLEKGKEIDVPDLRGMSLAEAKSILFDSGLYLIISDEVLDVTIPKGNIIDFDAHVGEYRTSGDVVNVVVSLGIKMARVPDVQYKTLAEATEALETLGLVVNLEYERSTTVIQDSIIRQDIEAGQELSPGSTVLLTVSSGDAPPPAVSSSSRSEVSSSSSSQVSSSSRAGASVTVPYVVGYSEDSATSAIAESGFRASVSHNYSNTVAKGNVISQAPGGGQNAQQNSAVNIVVSSGPDPAAENKDPPRVIGLHLRLAQPMMNNSGIPYRVEYVYVGDESDNNKVLDAYFYQEDGINTYVLEVGMYSE